MPQKQSWVPWHVQGGDAECRGQSLEPWEPLLEAPDVEGQLGWEALHREVLAGLERRIQVPGRKGS